MEQRLTRLWTFPPRQCPQEGQNSEGKDLAPVTERGSSALLLLHLWVPGNTGDHMAPRSSQNILLGSPRPCLLPVSFTGPSSSSILLTPASAHCPLPLSPSGLIYSNNGTKDHLHTTASPHPPDTEHRFPTTTAGNQ